MPTVGGIDPAPSSGLAALAAEAADAPGAAEAADAPGAADAPARVPTPVSLYVHVPFCVSKCAYCDFYSQAGGREKHARFVDAVLFEAGHWSHYDLLDDVPTLYIGGGTPTALGSELVRLVTGLRQTARLRPDAEITVETNPETTGAALVSALVDAGVNRFSLGVQSFDDAVLQRLGRCHDVRQTRAALEALRGSGAAYSVDLICGVPGQSFESWDESLEAAVASGARHVSVYPLTVEEGTPLAAEVEAGSVPPPDPDVAADMMLAAEVALAAAGLPRYEVANYAQPGHESRHNLVYWTGGAYLGLGPHAASMMAYPDFERVAVQEGWDLQPADRPVIAPGSKPARARFTRETSLDSYLRHPLAQPRPLEVLDEAEAAREDVMLGLRLTRGVPAAEVDSAGLTETLVGLSERGLVSLDAAEYGEERWRTTQQGWLLGNQVFGAVWNRD